MEVKLRTKYQKLIYREYADEITPDKQKEGYPPVEDGLLMLAFGPENYGVEEEMFDFWQAHKDATLEQMYEHFNSITPDLEMLDEDIDE